MSEVFWNWRKMVELKNSFPFVSFLILGHVYSKCEHNQAKATVQLIAYYYSETTANIIFASDNQMDYEINDFLDEVALNCFGISNGTVLIESWNRMNDNVHRRKGFNVIILKSFNGFLTFMNVLDPLLFSYRANFLIIIIKSEIPEITRMFECLWKKQIFNVNIMLPTGDVFTFLPFANNSCNNMNPVLINQFKNGTFLRSLSNFFPNKMKNLEKCLIRVGLTQNKPYIFKHQNASGAVILYGREIDLVEGLAFALNFEIIFVYINDTGSLLENGKATGTFKMLMDKKVDLIVGNSNLKPNRLKFIENTTPYISSQITFLIPPGTQLSSFENLFGPLRLQVWLLLLFYFAIGVAVIFWAKRQQSQCISKFVFGSSKNNNYLNMLEAIFGGSHNILPRENFARILLVTFVIFCLIIRTLYQGSLYRFLQSDIHHLEVQSIDDMILKGFKFYVSQSSLDLYDGDPKFIGR